LMSDVRETSFPSAVKALANEFLFTGICMLFLHSWVRGEMYILTFEGGIYTQNSMKVILKRKQAIFMVFSLKKGKKWTIFSVF